MEYSMKNRNTVLLAMLICILLPLDALAYLDPGAGSALLQGIIGGLAAIGVVLKLYWHRVLRILGIRKDSSKKIDYETTEKSATKSEEK
jgi:hypothetical protein